MDRGIDGEWDDVPGEGERSLFVVDEGDVKWSVGE